MAVVFQYDMDWTFDRRTEPTVMKASRAWVERFIPLEEFPALFGGYICWHAPDQPTREMPGEALGVWGRSNTVRFKRELRRRGAVLTVVKGEGPKQVVKEQVAST